MTDDLKELAEMWSRSKAVSCDILTRSATVCIGSPFGNYFFEFFFLTSTFVSLILEVEPIHL